MLRCHHRSDIVAWRYYCDQHLEPILWRRRLFDLSQSSRDYLVMLCLCLLNTGRGKGGVGDSSEDLRVAARDGGIACRDGQGETSGALAVDYEGIRPGALSRHCGGNLEQHGIFVQRRIRDPGGVVFLGGCSESG